MAHSGEHALVLRRTHASRAAQHEGLSAVLRDSLGFLEGIVRLSGQIGRHGLCANHRTTTVDHLEGCSDVQHEHRKYAQHSCQPKLRKLRDYQPSLRVSVSCHAWDYTRARAPVGSGGRYPTT